MAIVRMKKLTLAVEDSIREQILDELQALGAVHVDSLGSDAVEVSEETSEKSWTDNLKTLSVDILGLEEYRREIGVGIVRIQELCGIKAPEFEVTSLETIEKIRSTINYEFLASEIKELDRTTRESDSLRTVFHQELTQIRKWANTVDDFDPIFGKSKALRGVIGYIPETSLEAFSQKLAEATPYADVLTAWKEEGEAYCYVVAAASVWDSVFDVVKQASFNVMNITRRSGNTKQMIVEIEEEIAKQSSIYSQCMSAWEDYAEDIQDIALAHDILEMDIQKAKAAMMALSTERVNFFRAWVPEDMLFKVEAILSKYKTVDVVIEEPSEDEYEKVPVSLRNNAITRPFSALTTMYGTPMYGATVDPTPHLSVFYFLFYGICLGDALYGAVIALFSLVMMFKNRANQAKANFFALLAWSGFSAVVVGVILGSYAGDLFSKYIPIPALMKLRFVYADGSQFFDKPLLVLFFSLVIGAIQLWYGFFIKFLVHFKKNVKEAITSDVPWLILLAGFFLWASLVWVAGMANLTIVSEQTTQLFFLLMKIGGGLIILNATVRGFQKGIVSGLVGPLAGLWDLYGISGYLSNLLSYARLLALGLSSGIIANVFNQLSFGMIHSLKEISPPLALIGIILFIVLHLFSMVLAGFGAFVHALRLQFVEFFGQFMEGGGKDYSPLIRKGTHYSVK